MKRILLAGIVLMSEFIFAQTPCTNGLAGIFPCNKIDLQANLNFSQIGGDTSTKGSGCWGWTDPLTNKEYAIMGCTTHTAIVDITVPHAPVYLGKINSTNNTSSIWREVNVYNNYLYIVSEASGHGMQIFNLTRLRGVTTPQVFTPDGRYTGFGSCHTVAINATSGYAYCNGSNTYGGGPHVISLQNPLAPTLSFGYAAQGYTHDAQIVTYDGPDTDYTGHEIFIGANGRENKVVILDVTNKSNPVLISTFTYPNASYTHQGWFTADKKYWMLGDEMDEVDLGFNSKTIIIDMTDLNNPVLKGNYFGPTKAIEHNGYVVGNDYFLANYTAGIRIINTSNITATGTMNEIGYFDTYPSNDSAAFDGVWNIYPFFPSGNIIMSDISRGLFIVKKNTVLSNDDFEKNAIGIYPNPTDNQVRISYEKGIKLIEVFDLLGKKVKEISNLEVQEYSFEVSNLDSGIYLIRINNEISKKLIVK
ncbi:MULTISPECIES: choice-of-anchor B family protein [Flavobacterium]|uniref:choice-of-anchor B family protein n=1 Tax=Flavobacterium TaxID=237 RepID=UPI001FCC93ED|nr:MULTISPECIES: choice-of-anchor B family protein [Flavobacterium]UOK41539.1 choice-of-anchor B family protein [Flavobacterium enshiense]